ncbi:MAG: hypothetical protein IPM98_10645 [Lewinellaceae bacterium]|nr:hypothetical protein [Lewinellaceae bacterium]
MSKIYLSLFAAIIVAFCMASGCNHDAPKQESDARHGFDAATMEFKPDTLPEGVAPAYVDFRDQNTYISDGFFCIVSIVDNKSIDWVRIWARVAVQDSMGNTLAVNGDSSFVLRSFSDAVPPAGATSLFCAIPLKQISGAPAGCTLQGAGVLLQSPGPILIAPQAGGVRMQRPSAEDSTKIEELAYNMLTSVENPLPDSAFHPRLELLLYGNDKKLYFAQVLNPEDKPSGIYMEREGPLSGGEKREIRYPVLYQFLPQPLKDNLIGRIEVQAYEARMD